MNALKRTALLTTRIMVFILGVSVVCTAQNGRSNFEQFRFEYTVNVWPLSPSGFVRSDDTEVDLNTDLGIQDRRAHGQFQAVFKPGRKHRLSFESILYRLEGHNDLVRTIEFGGRTYDVRATIDTSARLNYLFAGYQYDITSRSWGHAGVLVGASYFDATATATSPNYGFASEQQKVPLPIVGTEFRIFPVANNDVLNFNGVVKGMSFGSYGRYVHGTLNAGFTIRRRVTLQAGYQILDLDIHEKDKRDRFKM